MLPCEFFISSTCVDVIKVLGTIGAALIGVGLAGVPASDRIRRILFRIGLTLVALALLGVLLLLICSWVRPNDCIGDIYNCDDFSSCDEVMDYFLACPGDPSHLDGDNNGIPCETLCRSESYTPSLPTMLPPTPTATARPSPTPPMHPTVEPGFLSLRASSPTSLVGPVPVTLIGPLEEAPPRVVEYMLPEYGWIIDTLPAVGTYEIIFSHPESGATVCDYEVWLDPAIPQSIGCYSELWALDLE